MRRFFLVLFVCLVCFSETCYARELRKVSLMLDWYPNVDHLPIYVAREMGFFRDEGLEVEILTPSDASDAIRLVAAGTVDLAVSYQPQALIGVSEGVDVRVIGRLVSSPLTCLLFLDDGRIGEVSDLSGKKVGYTVPGMMDLMFRAMALESGVVDYSLVNVGFNVIPSLVHGEVAAVMGPFRTYEVVLAEVNGVRTSYFAPEDYGIPPYDELIFIMGAGMYEKESDVAMRFRRAMGRGLEFVRQSPGEAVEVYLRALPDVDGDVERRAFEVTLPFFASVQESDVRSWKEFADFALKVGIISRPVDVGSILVD